MKARNEMNEDEKMTDLWRWHEKSSEDEKVQNNELEREGIAEG
jgi:predicted metal-dependent hydrolase